jgi:hypothetical protein
MRRKRSNTHMADKPMVGQADRPDLTVNTEASAASQPRDLETILGSSAAAARKLKEAPATGLEKAPFKETLKDTIKDHKDSKDHKEQKDHKEPKDHKDTKDNKDQKDHKDPKEHKDQKDQKDTKDHKDQKDTKEHKDPKEHKDQKDLKDHKEVIKEIKDGPKEIKENIKELTDVVTKPVPEVGPIPELPGDEMSQLIARVSGLEQTVEDLKKKK